MAVLSGVEGEWLWEGKCWKKGSHTNRDSGKCSPNANHTHPSAPANSEYDALEWETFPVVRESKSEDATVTANIVLGDWEMDSKVWIYLHIPYVSKAYIRLVSLRVHLFLNWSAYEAPSFWNDSKPPDVAHTSGHTIRKQNLVQRTFPPLRVSCRAIKSFPKMNHKMNHFMVADNIYLTSQMERRLRPLSWPF